MAVDAFFADRKQATAVPVARSVAPNLDLLGSLLERIVAEARYSNFGVLHQDYTESLGRELRCEQPVLFANATMALTTVLRALNVSGEVITTPFSFAASAHAISWAGARPVFCDVDASTLTLDAERVEAAITPQTTAILPVHIYGQPCDHEALKRVADKHGIPLVYDAAHAFGTCVLGEPIHAWGHATVYSLHGSKLAHCGEGGVLVANNDRLRVACEVMQNFGITTESTVELCGSNGKLPETSAALGLAVLPGVTRERELRAELRIRYSRAMADIEGVKTFELPTSVTQSEQYFAIRLESDDFAGADLRRDAAFNLLRNHNVHARRYFYPLCSEFPHYRQHADASPDNLPVSHRAASEILCLPFHSDVSDRCVEDIAFLIRQTRP